MFHLHICATVHHPCIYYECSSEHSETVDAIAMELADTASYYIKSVTSGSCVQSAVNNAHVVVIHDNDVQVNPSSLIVSQGRSDGGISVYIYPQISLP